MTWWELSIKCIIIKEIEEFCSKKNFLVADTGSRGTLVLSHKKDLVNNGD